MGASDTVCGGASEAATTAFGPAIWLPLVGPSPAASIGLRLDVFAGPGSDVFAFSGPEVSPQI